MTYSSSGAEVPPWNPHGVSSGAAYTYIQCYVYVFIKSHTLCQARRSRSRSSQGCIWLAIIYGLSERGQEAHY